MSRSMPSGLARDSRVVGQISRSVRPGGEFDDGAGDLEVVEVLRVDRRDRGRVPRGSKVLDHPRGGFAGVVPPFERCH